MDKEDKQIIERAVKEEWRIGDRTRLKRLLEKNLKQYRDNVELENKIADIKANCDLAIEGRDIKIKELEQKNAELKRRLDNLFNSDCWASDQLTKAKEIIKEFSEFANNEIEYDPEHPQEHTDLWNKLCEQVEQFLKDIKEG